MGEFKNDTRHMEPKPQMTKAPSSRPTQTRNSGVNIARVKRKDGGPLKRLTRWLFDNQAGTLRKLLPTLVRCWPHFSVPLPTSRAPELEPLLTVPYVGIAVSVNLIGLLLATHKFAPAARPYTSKFLMLSYYNSNTGKYAAGHDDCFFIAFCIVLFTGLRAGFMEHVLAPLARIWGLSKRKEVTRFSEQGWMLIHYTVFWPLGMVPPPVTISQQVVLATDPFLVSLL